MEKELVPSTLTLKLSPFEQVIYYEVKNEILTNSEIAKLIFKDCKRKPKSISNSVTSAVRQINRKLEKVNSNYRIVGKMKGRSGKVLCFEKITPRDK